MNQENLTPKTKMALWKKIAIGVLVFFVLARLAETVNPSSSATDNGRTKKKLTMAYVVASRTVKEALKDPDSYQEIDHKEYYEAGADSAKNNMQVLIHYRAKNSFGGYVVEKKAINFDSSGVIKEIYAPN